MGKKTVRYKDREQLRAAVIEQCHREWKQLTGFDWWDSHAAHVIDRPDPPDLVEARELAKELAPVLRKVVAFCDRPRDHIRGASGVGTRLKRFIEQNLAPLLAAHRMATENEGKNPNIHSPFVSLDLIANASHQWMIGVRGRIYVLLTDRVGYWRRFGLTKPATPHTMAMFSILVGEYPAGSISKLIRANDGGASVAEVLAAEVKAINEAKRRVAEFERRSKAAEAG